MSGREWRALAAFARLGWRRALLDRVGVGGLVLIYWLILAIFSGLWRATPLGELGGNLDESRLLGYLAVTEWIGFAVGLPYRDLEAEIQSGTVAASLTRPLRPGLAILATWAGGTAYRLVALGLAGLVAVRWMTGGITLGPGGAALLVLSALIATTLILLWHLQVGYAAAWIGVSAPMFWIVQKLMFVLGGLIMPLTIYPGALGTVARASPFAAMLFAPASLMLDASIPHALGMLGTQLAWLALGAAAALAVERAAERRFLEQGT